VKIKYTKGFKKDMDKLFHWKYAPLRWFKWWMNVPREIKWFFQRGVRGYAECDVWDLDSHITNILVPALKELKRLKKTGFGGCPTGLYDPKNKRNHCKKWHDELDTMIEGFKAHQKMMQWDRIEINQVIFNKGMKSFSKYYPHLWD